MTLILVALFITLVGILSVTLWRMLPVSARRVIARTFGIIIAGTVAVALLLAIGFAGANALADQLRAGFVYAVIEDEVIILDSAGIDWIWVFEDPDEYIELEAYSSVLFELKDSGKPGILDDEMTKPVYSGLKIDRNWADKIIAQYERGEKW